MECKCLARFVRGITGLLLALTSLTATSAQTALPEGFAYLRDIDPSIRQDIRYAGPHNFIGRPIAGYTAAECVLTKQTAHALSQVQSDAARRGLTLIVWDCYRPERAVKQFVSWTEASGDVRMKAEFYPLVDKARLIALGYIAARSAHSRGRAVDLGLAPLSLAAPPPWRDTEPLLPCTAPKGARFEDGAVDLGTGFDCFDPHAHFRARNVTETARANRVLLREAMARGGFEAYDSEWWHFGLVHQPSPDRSFDFSILPRASP